MKVGFLVNPIAGMGGSVGLKGTDGESILAEAVKRGAVRVSPLRAESGLRSLMGRNLPIEFLTCSGLMGELEIAAAGLNSKVVFEPARNTTRHDTLAAAKRLLELGVELIVFAGGDGTARDIFEAVGRGVPILGIPSGVKMQSAVFMNRPEELYDILMTFLSAHVTKDAEVMDVNEDSFRKGILEAKLYGIARVPDDPQHIQSSKMSYHSGTADEEVAELGQYIADTMEEGTVYIVGPGSTTAAIAEALDQKKTLLGTDVYLDRKAIVLDAGEKELLEVLEEHKSARIVVTPIGSQGFFFGRGNQQISPRVVRLVGVKNVIIVAAPTKLRDTPCLRIDTGDLSLDEELRGKRKIVTGYKRRKLVDVR